MSRIGRQAISIPTGVTIKLDGALVVVQGPKGTLSQEVPKGVVVKIEAEVVTVERKNEALQSKANHGLINRLVTNMITGVTEGYNKKLELVGTGYRAKLQGANLSILAGYSHPVEFAAPNGIGFKLEGETQINVSGIDKQLVGETAAKIRAIRPPEPYQGKGIKYAGEVIRRKAGKATKVGSG